MPASSDAWSVRERAWMRRALALAARGWGQTAPNPLIDAIVVRDGEIVGVGHHARFGERHAEAVALAQAGERARGADVYCTLEPCNAQGKQPPCTEALIAAGVRRVIAAIPDPNPAKSRGAERLRSAGIDVVFGLESQAATELNAPFLHWATGAERPWVTLKLAISLDGAIAAADRQRGWLTGEKARREVHRLRAGVDAIAVGIGTALADDPALTVRGVRKPRVAPLRVVFDRQARLPLTSQLARTARKVPTVIVATESGSERAQALVARGVEVIAAPDLTGALRVLLARGVHHLLVEGGATLAGALIEGHLVDRLVIFQAPVVLGAGALNAFAGVPPAVTSQLERWRVVSRTPFEQDVMTVLAPPGR